jgi:hypothetical protein
MKRLLFGVWALGASLAAIADPCVDRIPKTLQVLLQRQFPGERLPLASDSDAEDLRYAAQRGNRCLLATVADLDGDGRPDVALVLPARDGSGYRLVAALQAGERYRVQSLGTADGPVRSLYVEMAPPGTYRQTEAFPFAPAPGLAEQVDTRHQGFYFGRVESAADVYVLKQGQWLHVHVSD